MSGRRIEVAVGYIDAPGGDILVAAGDPQTDWARNLEANPDCRVRRPGTGWQRATAERLEGSPAALAVRELILKYGTPAERLGRGAVFRLRVVSPPAGR